MKWSLLPLALGLVVAASPQAPATEIRHDSGKLRGQLTLQGERWTYREGDWEASGILLQPEGKGPFPAVLVSHGLGGSASSFGRFQSQEFLRWGMVCIAPDYTHSAASLQQAQAGSPRSARRDFGASAENLRRARTCLDILRSLPQVDPSRLAAYGHSMGGFVTIGLAAENPSGLKAAAISGSGVAPQEGFPAPAGAAAKTIRVPLLMLHGSDDHTVRPEQSANLQRILQASGVPQERHLFEGAGHQFNGPVREQTLRLIQAWYQRHSVLPGP